MNYRENDTQKDINSILGIVKLGVLFFSVIIIFYQYLEKKNHLMNVSYIYSTFVIFYFFVPLMLVIYLLWSHFYVKSNFGIHCKSVLIAENLAFIALFSGLIIASGAYASQFKFLFLFVIISSVIQLGAKSGIITASISSFIVLTIDLIYLPQAAVNTPFQNDLILSGSLILAAWSLGRYSELQKENIDKKSEQLQLLNKKLDEQELQRKYIEELVFNNEACYNLLINNSTDAVFVHRDNKLIFSNVSAAKLTGVPLEQLIGGSAADILSLTENQEIKEKYNSIRNKETGTVCFEQILNFGADNTVIVLNTSTRFTYEGKPTILTILHDITSEKQVQVLEKDVQLSNKLLNESREFNKLITEFFSNISHELKTPLNIIFSSVQLLGYQSQVNYIQSKDKYLKVMKQNCYRLMRLINNLLDITRADAGFLNLHLKNCNIISLVEDITMSVATFAESKNIELIFDTDCEERFMAVDPDKLERIVLNLLSNSLKFTNSDGQIFVNLFNEKDHILISVKDNGIGIPEDKLQFIFERFRQVDKSFTRNHEGSGIGLSLVKSFVEMHQGSIEVSSAIGHGSEFIIKLPAKLCDEDYANDNNSEDRIIERISLEFSDIYS